MIGAPGGEHRMERADHVVQLQGSNQLPSNPEVVITLGLLRSRT
jgi:hypothetical protein